MIVTVVVRTYYVKVQFYLMMDFENLLVIDIELEKDVQLFYKIKKQV